jgi:hypothetical protein
MSGPSADSRVCRDSRVSRSQVSFERWRSLGRLLPADVRERLFDPAFADLTHAWLTATEKPTSGIPFGLRVLVTYMGCLSISVPRLFYRRRRLTRLSRVAVWALSVLAVVAAVVMRMTEVYAGYG